MCREWSSPCKKPKPSRIISAPEVYIVKKVRADGGSELVKTDIENAEKLSKETTIYLAKKAKLYTFLIALPKEIALKLQNEFIKMVDAAKLAVRFKQSLKWAIMRWGGPFSAHLKTWRENNPENQALQNEIAALWNREEYGQVIAGTNS
jgi:hypothetical protein